MRVSINWLCVLVENVFGLTRYGPSSEIVQQKFALRNEMLNKINKINFIELKLQEYKARNYNSNKQKSTTL